MRLNVGEGRGRLGELLGGDAGPAREVVGDGLGRLDELVVDDYAGGVLDKTYTCELLAAFGETLRVCWVRRCQESAYERGKRTISQSIANIRGELSLGGDSNVSSTFSTFVSTHPSGFSNVSARYEGIG